MSWANPRNWFGKKTPQEGKQFIYIYKIVLMIEICMFINPKIIFFFEKYCQRFLGKILGL